MIPSPCLHPKFITCRDGVKRSVPCGKCAACLINKGLVRSERLSQYISEYPYKFFLTLTFDDAHLPLAYYSDTDDTLYHPCDCDYDGVVYSYSLCDLDDKERNFVLDTLDRFGGVPVLSHRHLINFKKRLRYHLNQLGCDVKQLFIYGCGEYGPTTFRPHYHLLFGLKSNIETSIFEECVRKAWSICNKAKEGNIYEAFGFVYFERITTGDCASYVAKYLSCNTNLPKVFAESKFKPFACGSNRSSQLLERISQSKIEEVFYQPTFEVSVLRHGKPVSVPVPPVYISRYFPLVPRFNCFSPHELCALYGFAEKYPDSSLAYETFMDDYLKVVPYDVLLSRNRVFDGKCENSILPPTVLQLAISCCCFHTSNFDYIEDEFIRRRNLMRVWYISRRVVLNARSLGVSVSDYVDKIIAYHKSLKLDKLKRFYEMQESYCDDLIHPLSLSYLFTLYTNTDSNECDIDYYVNQFGYRGERISDIPAQSAYAFKSIGILKDTTKTKQRNDAFNSRGLKRKPFIPKLSKLINRFKQI